MYFRLQWPVNKQNEESQQSLQREYYVLKSCKTESLRRRTYKVSDVPSIAEPSGWSEWEVNPIWWVVCLGNGRDKVVIPTVFY